MLKNWLVLVIGVLVLSACGGDASDDTSEPVNQEPAAVSVAENRPVPPAEGSIPTGRVEDVVSADTIQLSDGQTAQLAGINAPDAASPWFEPARDFAAELLRGKEVRLESTASGIYVWVEGLLANYEIVRAGYANHVPSTNQYDGFLGLAEAQSQTESAGIWQRSALTLRIDLVAFDPPGIDSDNLSEEYVRIANSGGEPIALAGVTIRDNAENIYTFGEVTLEPGRKITLYSGCGLDNATEVFWCSATEIWNNAGDTVLLYDAEGQYIDHRSIAFSQ